MARPDPPVNVNASDGDETLVITWDATPGAYAYSVFRSTVAGSSGYLIGRTDETTWTDTLAMTGLIYWYSVLVNTSAGCSLLSDQESGYITSIVSALAAPENLLVEVIS